MLGMAAFTYFSLIRPDKSPSRANTCKSKAVGLAHLGHSSRKFTAGAFAAQCCLCCAVLCCTALFVLPCLCCAVLPCAVLPSAALPCAVLPSATLPCAELPSAALRFVHHLAVFRVLGLLLVSMIGLRKALAGHVHWA